MTILGLQLGALLSGSVITETVFSFPGIGDLLIQSISARDYKLTQVLILMFAITYFVVNLLVDLLYSLDRSEDQVLMLSLALFKNLGRRRDPAVLCVCGLAAPLLAPRDPQAQTLEDRLRPPRWAENGSPAYLLGTDNLGRDMLSRIIYGSRISLMVGATTVIFAGLVGCSLGAVAGYFGSTHRRSRQQDLGNISRLSVFADRDCDHGVSRPGSRSI